MRTFCLRIKGAIGVETKAFQVLHIAGSAQDSDVIDIIHNASDEGFFLKKRSRNSIVSVLNNADM